MPQKYPWHSKRPGETVYHDNTVCTEGNNIESYYMAQGTGGRTQYDHCVLASGHTPNIEFECRPELFCGTARLRIGLSPFYIPIVLQTTISVLKTVTFGLALSRST